MHQWEADCNELIDQQTAEVKRFIEAPLEPEQQAVVAVPWRIVGEQADVAIRGGSIADTSLSARKIGEFERTICAAPSYLARRGVPRTPGELARHVCVVAAPMSTRWPFHTRNGVDHVEIAPRVTTDNGEAALRLALDGAGIARLADVIIGEPIRQGLLVPLLTDVHHTELVPLSALYLAGRHRLPKVRVFLDFLVEQFASSPWRVNAQ